MTTREIQGHLEEIYAVDVSPGLISNITDAVLDEVRTWQSRPLDASYPILYLDALQVKVKSQGSVRNKAIYLAFGVTMSGLKEVLGIWASDNEGACVLDVGHYRVKESWSSRHFYRLRGRSQRLS